MGQENILNEFMNLPPEAQRQVVDFIYFLQTRYKQSQCKKTPKRTNLANESFVGIWQSRKDMKDSRLWLRNVRKSEWRGLLSA